MDRLGVIVRHLTSSVVHRVGDVLDLLDGSRAEAFPQPDRSILGAGGIPYGGATALFPAAVPIGISSPSSHLNGPAAERLVHPALLIRPDILNALRDPLGPAVVALESTIITHGMPYPQNAETALAVERMVRESGSLPATIAILDGRVIVGLTEAQIHQLSRLDRGAVAKCSRRDLAALIASKGSGSTTVAATMLVAHMAGISIFVTGGLGGVHREVLETMDISADLVELSKTPVAVVSAGVKSILDIPRTLELLETLGVPTVGYGTAEFPAFFSPRSGHPCSFSISAEPRLAAGIIREQLSGLRLGGCVIAVPIDEADAHPAVDAAIAQALEELHRERKDVRGRDVTPFLLGRVHELSGGESLRLNQKLIMNNARVGGQIARELKRLHRKPHALFCGAALLDVVCMTREAHLAGTSNPGTVAFSPGGVANNVCRAVHLVAGSVVDLEFFTAINPNDSFGQMLVQSLPPSALRPVVWNTELPTGSYTAIMDGASRDLVSAVADTAILDVSLTKEAVRQLLNPVLCATNLIVVDGNVKGATLAALCDELQRYRRSMPAEATSAGPCLFFEPTSLLKAAMPLKEGLLHAFDYAKPSYDELYAMCGETAPGTDPKDIGSPSFWSEMLRLGTILCQQKAHLRALFVTLGKEGALAILNQSPLRQVPFRKAAPDSAEIDGAAMRPHAHNEYIQIYHFPAVKIRPQDIISTNGAGDCFCAGIVVGLLRCSEMTLQQAMQLALQCANICLRHMQAVPAELASAISTVEGQGV